MHKVNCSVVCTYDERFLFGEFVVCSCFSQLLYFSVFLDFFLHSSLVESFTELFSWFSHRKRAEDIYFYCVYPNSQHKQIEGSLLDVRRGTQMQSYKCSHHDTNENYFVPLVSVETRVKWSGEMLLKIEFIRSTLTHRFCPLRLFFVSMLWIFTAILYIRQTEVENTHTKCCFDTYA